MLHLLLVRKLAQLSWQTRILTCEGPRRHMQTEYLNVTNEEGKVFSLSTRPGVSQSGALRKELGGALQRGGGGPFHGTDEETTSTERGRLRL